MFLFFKICYWIFAIGFYGFIIYWLLHIDEIINNTLELIEEVKRMEEEDFEDIEGFEYYQED